MKNTAIIKYLHFILGRKRQPIHYYSQLNPETVDDIRCRLKALMGKRRPFLQKKYSIRDLANDLNIPAYQVSGFMNQEIGVHFCDYINRHRIRYCEGLILSDDGLVINLRHLAGKCGFNNRNSFTKAFKKFTGQNPSEYLKHR